MIPPISSLNVQLIFVLLADIYFGILPVSIFSHVLYIPFDSAEYLLTLV